MMNFCLLKLLHLQNKIWWGVGSQAQASTTYLCGNSLSERWNSEVMDCAVFEDSLIRHHQKRIRSINY